MGMFDTLYCKKKLPLSKELKALKNIKWEELDFQTKDLDETLNEYEITKTGKLRVREVEREWVDDDSALLKGYMKEVSSKWVDTGITATVDFYTSFSTNEQGFNIFTADELPEDTEFEGDDWWVEFTAEIVKGRVKSIKLLKANAEPVQIRFLRERTWALENKAQEAKLHNKIRRFFRKSKTYCKATRFLYRGWSTLSSKVSNFLIRL